MRGTCERGAPGRPPSGRWRPGSAARAALLALACCGLARTVGATGRGDSELEDAARRASLVRRASFVVVAAAQSLARTDVRATVREHDVTAPDGCGSVWGTWTAAGCAEHGDFSVAVSADGAFGVVTSSDGRAVRVLPGATHDEAVFRAVAARAPSRADPDASRDSHDERDAATPRRAPGAQRRAARIIDIAVLFTPRALVECGAGREHLKHCFAAAVATANEAALSFGEDVCFRLVGVVAAPVDCRGSSASELWDRVRGAHGAPLAAHCERVRAALGADIVCLVAGRRGDRTAGFATWSESLPDASAGRVAHVVVRADSLRAADLTLAHELGHALGLGHDVRTSSAMGPASARRARVYPAAAR